MNVLDLFSGIGGFSLGLERAGMRTVAFCECEPFPRRVLAERWPNVPIYEDVRTLTGERLRSDGIAVDVICGGFPCQDISFAGKGAGLAGERSGLWREFARLIGEIRPRFAIVENVSALLNRGFGDVLGDLAEIGFDAEWHCIPASAVGAPHRRDRLWIVAYPNDQGEQRSAINAEVERRVAHAANSAQMLRPSFFREQSNRALRSYWPQSYEQRIAELHGMVDGISTRVDGCSALGNAVVPAIPEIIGRAIMRLSVTENE